MRSTVLQPVVAGIVAAVTGYAAAFAIVLAGLRAVGASPAEAASGLIILTAFQGLLTIWGSLRTRTPLSFAFSTPGAAVLVASRGLTGDFRAAVGAFLLCGVLLLITGLWPWLARATTRIPRPIASAMLAGILLPICLAPAEAVAQLPPLIALPPILVWLVLLRLAPRWAVAGAVVATGVVVGFTGPHLVPAELVPSLRLVLPSFDPLVLVGIGIPLYIVTMAGQNVPGFAVMRAFGYDDLPARWALGASGGATVVGSFLGAHALNLSAITAGMTASPEAHPDRSRRWIAALACGIAWVVLAAGSAASAALVAASLPLLVTSVAGLALFGAFAGSVASALEEVEHRIPAVATFVVVASGVRILSIGSAFWGLVAGGVIMLVLHVGRRRPETSVEATDGDPEPPIAPESGDGEAGAAPAR
jgi:benzoate membrane transport protein